MRYDPFSVLVWVIVLLVLLAVIGKLLGVSL